jgi:hypothetical protein
MIIMITNIIEFSALTEHRDREQGNAAGRNRMIETDGGIVPNNAIMSPGPKNTAVIEYQ